MLFVTNSEIPTVTHELRAQGSQVSQMVIWQMGVDSSEFSCAFLRAAPRMHQAYNIENVIKVSGK